MSIASATAYTANSHYDLISSSTSSTKNTSTLSTNEINESGSSSEDSVTFSRDLSMARIQEALGLEPTGKLKLKELETVAENREEFVALTIELAMETLGIDPDQEFSVYLDSENEIYLSGDFSERGMLEEALNDNEDFSTAFMQLTANKGILGYISELQDSVQNNTASLMDYFESDADLNDLLSLATEYNSIRTSSNMMETLLDLSSSETSYTYTYNENVG